MSLHVLLRGQLYIYICGCSYRTGNTHTSLRGLLRGWGGGKREKWVVVRDTTMDGGENNLSSV
jgi:hypothetical protein